ncbi:hypothetical protein WJX84_005473 [Apatococcus fuscideae]|uniref:Ubiquinol-cytochrome c chaperone domain-containing protein n=1 Tax=Apatococcus fuscideae TaxID=2026836 RepID=A0AAW1TG56_9CHLO
MIRRGSVFIARVTHCQLRANCDLARLAAVTQGLPEGSQTWSQLHSWTRGFATSGASAGGTTSSSAAVFTSKPQTLEFDRPVEVPQEGVEQSWWKKWALVAGGYYSKESRLLRGARHAYEAVTEQAGNTALYEAIGLEKRFAHEYSILCIHVWLLLLRLRQEGKEGAELAQMMYEDFQEDVEMRVRASGVKVRLGHHLKELEKSFYGSSMAFDQALEGKEELSAALVRNVYGEESGLQAQASSLANYIKREIACLKITPTEALMTGKFRFSSGLP